MSAPLGVIIWAPETLYRLIVLRQTKASRHFFGQTQTAREEGGTVFLPGIQSPKTSLAIAVVVVRLSVHRDQAIDVPAPKGLG